MSASSQNRNLVGRLRRDLGSLESYAALVGILVGAGIFRVTSDAWALTGPSVILGYLLLAPAVVTTSVAYAVFLSTSLGRLPGGEYTHLSRTFGGTRAAFVGTWLKIISYIGALAYLGSAFADYLLPLTGGALGEGSRTPVALVTLFFFYLVHVIGVRWFGRLQVAMFALLGVSLAVLVGPGLLAIEGANYRPFFTGGLSGFAASLPLLFFAYAGFESLAQTAGEVKDSRSRLPAVFLRGTIATTIIFALMSVVAFGVLPGERLRGSTAPMSDVAGAYLPGWGVHFVTLGALMALTTSLNATMLVPSRLGVMLAEDGRIPLWLGSVSRRTGTPVTGLTLTFLAAAALVLTGRLGLALDIAVLALVILYFLHSLALLLLPRFNPPLLAEATVRIPAVVRNLSAVASLLFMGVLLVLRVREDQGRILSGGLGERITREGLTSIELALLWAAGGLLLHRLAGRRE